MAAGGDYIDEGVSDEEQRWKVLYSSSFCIISKTDWPSGSPVVGSIVLHELYYGLLSVQKERKRTMRGSSAKRVL